MAEFLKLASVAEFFDTSPATVKRWIERGVIPPPSIIGTEKRWHVDSLRAAVRTGLETAATHRTRPNDPDEIAARLLRDGPQNRKANARRRHG